MPWKGTQGLRGKASLKTKPDTSTSAMTKHPRAWTLAFLSLNMTERDRGARVSGKGSKDVLGLPHSAMVWCSWRRQARNKGEDRLSLYSGRILREDLVPSTFCIPFGWSRWNPEGRTDMARIQRGSRGSWHGPRPGPADLSYIYLSLIPIYDTGGGGLVAQSCRLLRPHGL